MTIETSSKLTNVGIQQFSISYHQAEDRLIFRIGMSNDYEIVTWLTRRSAKSLSELLNNTSLSTTKMADGYTHENPQIAQEMAKNTLTQQLDFSTEYQTRKPMQTGQLFLVHECNMINTASKSINLELLCTNKKSIKLVLNDQLLVALINMLQLAIRHADWGLSVSDSLLMPYSENSKYSLH
ncbi:MAG: hypothetical protein GQ569_02365 [Methylococcaceae bacterium]|nr:hypothetical protein [Methylococcaceae bacterium]